MLIHFGKYTGKSVALVALKHPDYIKWVLAQSEIKSPLAEVRTEVERLISIFDEKPFNDKCCIPNCEKPVVKVTIYTHYGKPIPGIMLWCDMCDPYRAGVVRKGQLREIKTYRDALGYTKKESQSVIRDIACAKGLPWRCGEIQAETFFTNVIDQDEA